MEEKVQGDLTEIFNAFDGNLKGITEMTKRLTSANNRIRGVEDGKTGCEEAENPDNIISNFHRLGSRFETALKELNYEIDRVERL